MVSNTLDMPWFSMAAEVSALVEARQSSSSAILDTSSLNWSLLTFAKTLSGVSLCSLEVFAEFPCLDNFVVRHSSPLSLHLRKFVGSVSVEMVNTCDWYSSLCSGSASYHLGQEKN